MNYNIKTAAFAALVALGSASGCSAMNEECLQKKINVTLTRAQKIIDIALNNAPAEDKMVAIATDKKTGEIKEIFRSDLTITFEGDLVKTHDKIFGLVVTINNKTKAIETTIVSPAKFSQKTLPVQKRTIKQDMDEMQKLSKRIRDEIKPVVDATQLSGNPFIGNVRDEFGRPVNILETKINELGITTKELPDGLVSVRCEKYKLLMIYKNNTFISIKEDFEYECIDRMERYGWAAN